MAFKHADSYGDFEGDRVVLFKHSKICPVSTKAKKEVEAFSEEHPDVPVFMIVVQDQRILSDKIAENKGIKHESPQVIVIEHGETKGVLNQGDIKKKAVEELLD